MSDSKPVIGFIGVGLMGHGMAKNIVTKGYPLVIVMAVAIFAAKFDQIDTLETLLGFEEVAYMALFGWLAVAGPGPVSLDWLLQRTFTREPMAAPQFR